MSVFKDISDGAKALFTKKPKKDKKAKDTKPKYTKTQVQVQNMSKTTRGINKTIDLNANKAIKIKHKGGSVPNEAQKKVVEAGSKVLQKTFGVLDKAGNSARTGLDYAQTGKDALKGVSDGWKGEKKTRGKDLITHNAFANDVIDAPIDFLVKDKAKNKKTKSVVKGITGFGLEVGLDPLTYVSFGGGGLAKGLVSGIGGTVGRETAEAGAKIAGKQLLRSTVGKSLQVDDLMKAIKDVPKAKQAEVMEHLVKQVKSGGAVAKYSDEVSALANKAYNNLAKDVADKSGYTMQKMLNAKAGSGVKIGKKELVSSGKMRDIGANLNKKIFKNGSEGREINNSLMEAFRRGSTAGLTTDEYHLLRMIDSSARGFTARGFDDAMRDIGKVSHKSTKGDEAVARYMLENGKDSVTGMSAKQMEMYTTLRGLGDDMAQREVLTGMLNAERVNPNYMPRVKNMNLPKVADDIYSKRTAKQAVAKELNPKLRSSKDRVIQTNSVREANQVLRESDKRLAGIDFFEESPTKAFAQRAKKHYEQVGQKFRADDILESVGRKLSPKEIKYLGKADNRNALHQVYKNSDTTVLQRSVLAQVPVDDAGTTLGDILAHADATGGTVYKILKEGNFKGDPTALAHLANALLTRPDDLITNLTQTNLKAISSVIQTNLKTGADLPVHVLSKRVLDSVVKQGGTSLDNVTSKLLKGVDTSHNMWKPLKTSLNPVYHINNVMGGTANTIMDVGIGKTLTSVPDTLKYLALGDDAVIKGGGRQYSGRYISDVMEGSNVMSSSFAKADLKTVGRHIDDVTSGGGFLKHPLKSTMDFAGNVTNTMEKGIRSHEMIANLKKGLDPLTSAERVKMHQFDYGDITNFEKKVMKRLMPFYTYKSKNVPLQLTKLLDNPSTHYRMLKRAPELIAEEQGVDYESLPEYLKEQTPVFTGRNDLGMPRYFSPSLPQKDIYSAPVTGKTMNVITDAVNMSVPIAKAGFETLYDTKIMPYGEVKANNDKKNPAYFFGKTIPRRVSNVIDTLSPAPNLKYFDTENLRGKTVQPMPETFGFLKEFDETANAKSKYYDRSKELDDIMEVMKKAGVEFPRIDEIIGRKNSRKYNQSTKDAFVAAETVGYNPLNPKQSDFKTEEDYQKAVKAKALFSNVPEDFKPETAESWAEFIRKIGLPKS